MTNNCINCPPEDPQVFDPCTLEGALQIIQDELMGLCPSCVKEAPPERFLAMHCCDCPVIDETTGETITQTFYRPYEAIASYILRNSNRIREERNLRRTIKYRDDFETQAQAYKDLQKQYDEKCIPCAKKIETCPPTPKITISRFRVVDPCKCKSRCTCGKSGLR